VTPTVSVVIRVRDGERFLGEAIDSVLGQSLQGIEVIVVDDGSNDGTPAILKRYARSDPRIAVRRQGPEGAAVAANRGVAQASASMVAMLDADDIAVPTRLERQSRFLAEHPSVAVVGGAMSLIDEQGTPIADASYPLVHADIIEAFDRGTPIANPAVMFRKDAFEQVGGYRPQLVPAADFDLWLRVSERYELANLPDVVVSYRLHTGQLSLRRLEEQSLCAVAARVARRTRAAGGSDPFDGVERIDRQAVLAAGADGREISATLVRSAVWLAKTMDLAGHRESAQRLFERALVEARLPSGSGQLAAYVHRERARLLIERRSLARAGLESLRARVAERGS
jgi:hypothetical protein